MGDKQRDVVKTVSSTIAAVFSEGAPECHAGSSEFSVVVVRKVEYLEVLTENFKLGEAALKQQLEDTMKAKVNQINILYQYCPKKKKMKPETKIIRCNTHN